MIDLDLRLLKIVSLGLVDVYKLLRVSVHQWKPTTLYLHHYPVSFFERVGNIGQIKLHFFYLIRCEGLRLLKTLAEASAHDFATHQHLVATHRIGSTC